MTTEELAADELLQKTREDDDFTIDALLALLAFTAHGEQEPIMEAREEGAETGAVGNYACFLMERAEDALR